MTASWGQSPAAETLPAMSSFDRLSTAIIRPKNRLSFAESHKNDVTIDQLKLKVV
jgi:hypothetical protein